MVKIQYNGPLGGHLVVSPRRQISTYGLHTRGDVFEVFETDQKAQPHVFVLFKEEKRVVEPEETPEVAERDADPSGTSVMADEIPYDPTFVPLDKPALKHAAKKKK